ncbi:MAG: hypothetical protein JWM14_1490 [Chitinophagaceae bacterium]|nr:hypothetical protein [Chitinophagaceae bacterium]
MENEEYKKALKEAFDFFYGAKHRGYSYNELYDFLLEKGYTIEDEGSEGFRYNQFVNRIFVEITGEDFGSLYKSLFTSKGRAKDFARIDNHTSKLSTPVPLHRVPIFSGRSKNNNEDIYIVSLQIFKASWLEGLTFAEYLYTVRNIYGISIENDNVLIKIYREITDTKAQIHETWHEKHFATTESIFRLLEYQELQESFKQSKEAKWWSFIALFLSLIGIVISIYFSQKQIDLTEDQMKSDPKIDSSQFDEIQKSIKVQQDQNERIILLLEQENKVLSDTLKVKIQGRRK